MPLRLYAKSIILLFLLLFICLRGFVVRTNSLWVEELRPALTDYFEPRNLRLVKVNFWGHFYQVFMPSNENVGERTSEVSSIKISCGLNTSTSPFMWPPFLNHVDFLTFRAKNLNSAAS